MRWDSSMSVAWLWEERADSSNMCLKGKEVLLMLLIRIATIKKYSKNYQRISGIIFKIWFSRSCSPSYRTKQTCFGNFTCPQTHFGGPKTIGRVLGYTTKLLVHHHLIIKMSRHDKFGQVELYYCNKFNKSCLSEQGVVRQLV